MVIIEIMGTIVVILVIGIYLKAGIVVIVHFDSGIAGRCFSAQDLLGVGAYGCRV